MAAYGELSMATVRRDRCLPDNRMRLRLCALLTIPLATFRSSRPGPISAAADDRVRPMRMRWGPQAKPARTLR